ncbi:MAG: peptidoglycan DD-metalloendopeptidase family protein [Herpetosiphonaceae bacterium]|nr:peptidoglycan DD-metalloendopeptidase family protein [Herpetosiphonaceae bacterium]
MARHSSQQPGFRPAATGPLRRALRWDARLPRPLLLLLVLDLLLLVPIPFLLPRMLATPTPAPAASVVTAWPPLTARLSQSEPLPAGTPAARTGREAPQPLPLLINPLRLQDATSADSNIIAAVLGHTAPALAAQTIDVGGGLRQSLASIITGQALRWNLNPQVLLVLLETQSQLLSTPNPTTSTLALALRGPASQPGLGPQINWAALELRAGLLEPARDSLQLIDGSAYSLPDGLDQANYALLRFLAQTHTRAELNELLGSGPRSWVALAQKVMGDPRSTPMLVAIDRPFLRQPFDGPLLPTARFDHHYPLVQADGQMLGNANTLALGYDGHNGWDYELARDTPVLAAAAGRVLYGGWMDNGCATPAGVVVLQHANGYRTGYWHLGRVDVAAGDDLAAGAALGLAGSSGCAQDVHLHFSVQRLGRDVDPAGWCQASADPWASHPVGAASRWLWRDQIDACALPANVIIADDSDPATTLVQGEGWNLTASGNYGGARWATGALTASARLSWRPAVPAPGRYQLYTFIPNAAAEGGLAVYQIAHADGRTLIPVVQREHAGSWVSLGSFRLLAGQSSRVELHAADGTAGVPLWFDAIALERELVASEQ